MEIKVKTAVGSQSKTASTLDLSPEISHLPERIQTKIKNDVGEYLKEQILLTVAKEKSPVAGEDWDGLSIGYKKKKKAEGFGTKANMEAEGDMLDALDYKTTPDGVEIGVYGAQAWKADGHNKLSGKENNTPQRRFLPDEGQEFESSIQKGVEQIIHDAVADSTDLSASDFSDVTTKADLYDILGEIFEDMSRAEIRATVLSTPRLVALLDNEDLLELL